MIRGIIPSCMQWNWKRVKKFHWVVRYKLVFLQKYMSAIIAIFKSLTLIIKKDLGYWKALALVKRLQLWYCLDQIRTGNECFHSRGISYILLQKLSTKKSCLILQKGIPLSTARLTFCMKRVSIGCCQTQRSTKTIEAKLSKII